MTALDTNSQVFNKNESIRSDKRLPNFLIYSIQGWTDMWVSKHWIAAALAEHGNVYFVEPYRGAFLRGRGAKLKDFFNGPRFRMESKVNVVTMTSPPGYYSGPGWYRALSRGLMKAQTSRLRRKLGGGPTYVLTFDYRSEPLIRELGSVERVLYYAIDIISSHKNDPWWPESSLIRTADAVLTTSQRHKDRLINSFGRQDIEVVPHGVDFINAAKVSPQQPIESKNKKNVIGYTGSIHDTYVNFDVIRTVATQKPDWEFVFIGPVNRNALSVGASERIQQIASLPNVKFLGAKPYQELPGYISSFDVCIMPYALTVDNEPFKTLNYFAQGKPVVAADVPGVSEYQHLLYTYRTAEEMIIGVEKALAESTDFPLKAERIEFARQRDFSQVGRKLMQLFGLA
ncbi:Putative teichuronic acid biosynthesis glycosyltransferase TuaH [Pigmentiphaga humi]|uniref:Teichuronic acid biosynthesis glycosyltransferase TuaH n=1 Tax=Pigmentiphaga humi TaxID=2478468 RepID=A0A3P4B2K1_9BURK|nr:glycosyltransferase [Pigmentiphaga humi]VCU70111.1 Putative teichuronic acid biosynthesis glycosyltransferase TuaH [Pigmentiphaga humi]